jgi:hypothetical protein
MPNSRKELPERRVDYRQRVHVAVRKAHDQLFSNLKNPAQQPAQPQPAPRRPEEEH